MSIFELRWGILSTGFIARTFATDLLATPESRDVFDIKHRIVAVASRSAASARNFVEEHLKDSSVKSLGSYDELYEEDDVQIVYIATPHSHHYENCMAALQHGKHVLLEKPATVNAKQWRALCDVARRKKLFLMEAVWTRFFPLVYEYQKIISRGDIGDIEHVFAEFAHIQPIYHVDMPFSGRERFSNPSLAPGSLLDAMPYPLTHILMAVPTPFGDANPPEGTLPLPRITSTVVKSSPTLLAKHGGGDADDHTFATLVFPSKSSKAGPYVVAQAQTSLLYFSPEDRCVQISGTKGRITVQWPPFRPTSFFVEACATEREWIDRAELSIKQTKSFDFPGGIYGFAWEADECARCVRDGQRESDRMPWRETGWTMDVIDIIREQNDYRFPSAIESV